jgi:hypothetical protein
MSPSEFVQKAGGDISSIARCFRQLEQWGYTETVDGHAAGRASVQDVYQPTPQAPLDPPPWDRVLGGAKPFSAPRAILDSFFSRVGAAAQQGLLAQDIGVHLSHEVVLLDQTGWRQLSKRQDELLGWLTELATEAKGRKRILGSALLPTTVFLTLFRAPLSARKILRTPAEDYPRALEPSNRFEMSPRTVKALSNPWRSRILIEMGSRPMSPSQFVEEIGGEASYVARCFRDLASWGLIELVEERNGGRRGGGVERIFRNAQRLFFDDETWPTLPWFLRAELINTVLAGFSQQVTEALEAGTLLAADGCHAGMKVVPLDEIGWRAVIEKLSSLLYDIAELGRESLARTDANPDELLPGAAGMAGFRALPG